MLGGYLEYGPYLVTTYLGITYGLFIVHYNRLIASS